MTEEIPVSREKLCGCGCGGVAPIETRTNASTGKVKGDALDFISGHNSKMKSGLALLMARISVPSLDDCWTWDGPINRKGYGNVQVRGVKHNAHRAVYLELGHSIPDGYHLDHLCRNKICVNPWTHGASDTARKC